MYNVDVFNTVVFTAAELAYWTSQVPAAAPGSFIPVMIGLESKWEVHSVLLRQPSEALLVITPRERGWQDGLEKALREIHADLAADIPANIMAREVLRTWVGSRITATGLFKLPSGATFLLFSRLGRHRFDWRPAVSAAAAVDAAAVRARHVGTVGSSVAPPVRAPPPRASVAAPALAAAASIAAGANAPAVPR